MVAVLATACGGDAEPPPDPPPEPPIEQLPEGNPIDRVMEAVFAGQGITPVEAGYEELCRRLSGDLLGYFVTADEAKTECKDRTVDEIVRDFQSRPDYLVTVDRRWRDRLNLSDLFVNWHEIDELYERIHLAHSHELRYGDLATEVLGHPAFLLQYNTPEQRSAAAFRAFLNRQPTEFEEIDLANMFRGWFLGNDTPDADFPYFKRYHAHVVTGACFNPAACTSILFGGGQLDMHTWNFEMVLWPDATPELKGVLGETGRMFTRQLSFWDAAADELLSRYLGWSDGGRTPREPGAVLPEVRQALADYLRISGDYADAERMVLTSWLYRQTTHMDAALDIPVYASGPVKPTIPEVWLTTMTRHTVATGRDEPRFPDTEYQQQISQAYDDGVISLDTHNADLQRLNAMQRNRSVLIVDQNGKLVTMSRFRGDAHSLGGAPGLGRVRQAPEGLAFAFFHDAIAEQLCNDANNAGTTVDDALDAWLPRLYGRAVTIEDRTTFAAAYATCSGDDCAPQAISAAICVALATAPEMHFY